MSQREDFNWMYDLQEDFATANQIAPTKPILKGNGPKKPNVGGIEVGGLDPRVLMKAVLLIKYLRTRDRIPRRSKQQNSREDFEEWW